MKKLLFVIACLPLSSVAFAQTTTTITGTVRDINQVPRAGVRVRAVKADATGQLITIEPREAITAANGTFSLLVPRSSVVSLCTPGITVNRISSNCASPTNFTIGNVASIVLDDLIALGSVPTQGVTVRDEGTGLPTLVGNFNFAGAGVTVTQPSAGQALITIAGGGGGGGSLEVKEVDGTPAVASVATLQFLQTAGFVVSEPSAGIAQVTLAAVPNSALANSAITINGSSTALGASVSVGTVTSFSAGDLSPLFTTSEATATTTPALSFTLSTQVANRVFAGPTTGGDAVPTFRALVTGDIPDLSATYATAAHTHTFASLTSKPTTLSGYGITDAQGLDATLTALAGLNSTAGLVEQTGADAFTKRAIGVAASTDIPTRADADTRYAAASHSHAAADITSGQLALARGGSGADLSATGGANQFVRQNSAGGVLTVSAIADADVPDTITLTNITQVTNRAISDTTGTLGETRGGTNQTTYATGDILYASSANTLSKLAAGSNGQVLKLSGGVPAWQSEGGGTAHNLLSATHSDSTAGTVVRGDLITGQDASATWKRLALGASGRFLRSDGTDALWSTIQAGDVPDLSGVYQPLDADLTAVAALSTTGILARTGAATYTPRTITGTANKVDVTNGNGVSGNPTLTLPDAVTLVTPTVSGLLSINAGYVLEPTTTATSYSVLVTDSVILVTSTAAPRTITLPNSGLTVGQIFTIKDTSGGAMSNNITVDGNGATIDGSSTIILDTNFSSLSIQWTGSSFAIR